MLCPIRPGGVAQGQSKRLIIAESVVRVHPPLQMGLNPPTSRTEIGRGGVLNVRSILSAVPCRG